MNLSLDSNVIVDLLRGERPHVRARIGQAQADGDALLVSAIVVQELVMGAHRSARPEHHLRALDALLAALSVEPWTREDAEVSGKLRADCERAGRRMGAFDTLIAGQALARGWTLVTADVGDFERVDGLSILDWSDPTGARAYVGGRGAA